MTTEDDDRGEQTALVELDDCDRGTVLCAGCAAELGQPHGRSCNR